MVYREFQDLKLSGLGFGCMRLPHAEGDNANIDEAETAKMIDYAYKHGVNYYDTAWGYHGGNSEIVMGKILKAYDRDSFYLASKFPGYDVNCCAKKEETFAKQLEKCQVDYFDFYLLHNVTESNIESYLSKDFGIKDYFVKMKAEGKIRHLGFSAHGTIETMRRFLEVYGDVMEFCQIQLNWLDWSFQDAKGKVDLLNEYNIPVWVMEPLRGGKLFTLADNYIEQLKAVKPEYGVTEWAFRFLQSLPEVKMILSGMSAMEHVVENVAVFETEKPLTCEEKKTLLAIADDMTAKKSVPCTACRYCVEYCPQGLDIPELISVYNEYIYTDGEFAEPAAIKALDPAKKPSACLSCGSCMVVCPQSIKIPEVLAEFNNRIKKA